MWGSSHGLNHYMTQVLKGSREGIFAHVRLVIGLCCWTYCTVNPIRSILHGPDRQIRGHPFQGDGDVNSHSLTGCGRDHIVNNNKGGVELIMSRDRISLTPNNPMYPPWCKDFNHVYPSRDLI